MSGREKTGPRPSMRLLASIGALTFVANAALLAPASLLAPALAGAPAPIAYERLEGRIWRGKIIRLQISEHDLGDVEFAVSPLPLFLGRLQARIRADGGAGEGAGRVSYGLLDQSLKVSDAKFSFDLGSVRRYTIFGLPYQGDLTASVDSLVWTKNGCREAEAEIWTDLLDASSRQLAGEGMELSGAAACDGARLALTLRGENSEGRAEVIVSLGPDMTYQLVASVEPRRAELQENLQRLGFEDNGASLVYDAMGAIKGLGS